MTTLFGDALAACIESIPVGKVATCGSIARALGDVRAARAVADWLRQHPELDPAHRVVRADGQPVLAPRAGPPTRKIERTSESIVSAKRFADTLNGMPLLRELRAIQVDLARRVRETDDFAEPLTYGGVDAAYRGNHAFAAAVTLDATSLRVLDSVQCVVDVDFPYIPSYLAFREFPVIEEALSLLRRSPDVLFIDGHGRLHPALFGLACYAGISLDIPTIGIAKHPLVGSPAMRGRTQADAIPIEYQGATRGYVWRPPGASRPFYISVGHRISPEKALALAQQATRDRYPEPLRVADRLSKEGKEKKNGERSASGPTAARRTPAQAHEGV